MNTNENTWEERLETLYLNVFKYEGDVEDIMGYVNIKLFIKSEIQRVKEEAVEHTARIIQRDFGLYYSPETMAKMRKITGGNWNDYVKNLIKQ